MTRSEFKPTQDERTTSVRPTDYFPPRGLRRTDAARYVGISPSTFDEWVKCEVLPRPRKQGGVVLWDRLALDSSMDTLFYPDEDSDEAKWDDVRA